MKSNLLLPLFLLILLGGTAFFYLSDKTSSGSSSEDGDWVMHVEDRDDIHRIFIADREGGTADIRRRDGNYWIYNDKFNANPNVLANVLDAVTRIRLQSRPAQSMIPNMIKTLSTKSTKVELYDKNDKVLKSFYVGGVTPNELGTFMILEGSDNPYIMEIPYAHVSLKQRFFTGDHKWRDKTLVEYNPKDILSVSAEYPKRKNKSFKLAKNKESWKVEPFYPTTRKIEKEINSDLVESYLKGFKKVGAENFESRPKFIKRETNQREFCILTILHRDGTEEEIHFFPIQTYENDDKTKPEPVVRYLAVNSKKDFYLTQHLVFQDLFWAYEFFFEG